MADASLAQLKEAYRALRAQQDRLEVLAAEHPDVLDSGTFRPFAGEVHRILANAATAAVPPFDESLMLSHHERGLRYYRLSAVRSYLALAVAAVGAAAGEPADTPTGLPRAFPFIRDAELRSVLERDYLEIQRAYAGRCWKSVIILAGGATEAVLADLVARDPARARAARRAPEEADISRWGFADLINVAVELKLVSSGVQKLSHAVRAYRNLVHPANEVRTKLAFGEEEARIAVEVLHILSRELSGQ